MTAPGTLLDGRYRVQERLGAGAMGLVFSARDETLGRDVAVKVLPPEAAMDLELIGRFVREGQAAMRVRHPNIIVVHELVSAEGQPPFLVLERLAGQTLEERLSAGPLAAIEAARVAIAVLAGLDAVHRAGIVHRDVKPSNIFLCDHGGGGSGEGAVKLIDFGIAKVLDQHALTRTGNLVGTPIYMAPEQLREEPVDPRTDIYAVGATLYEILAGRPPFVADGVHLIKAVLVTALVPLVELRPGVDAELARIVHTALAKSSAMRFATADEMRVRLEGWLHLACNRRVSMAPEGAPTASANETATARLERPRQARVRAPPKRRRNRRGLALGAFGALFVALTAGGGLAAWLSATASKREQLRARTPHVTSEASSEPDGLSAGVSASMSASAEASMSASAAAPATSALPVRPAPPVVLQFKGATTIVNSEAPRERQIEDEERIKMRLIRYVVSDMGLGHCHALNARPCYSPILASARFERGRGVVVSIAQNGCYSPAFYRCATARAESHRLHEVAGLADDSSWESVMSFAPER